MAALGTMSTRGRRTLQVNGSDYAYFSISEAGRRIGSDLSRLPASLAVLLENVLRWEDGRTADLDDIRAFGAWCDAGGANPHEIAFRPARVLMQDFTGVPAVVDLAAMRDCIARLGGDPQRVNPLTPVDLVIDHSVMIDAFGAAHAFRTNVAREYERNIERYAFLKWGQAAFDNFRVVPPGTGICHQVNLEFLASGVGVMDDAGSSPVAFPDTLVGTDSHTTMINALGVLGWGVGGIEAEAAMLGQPVSMLMPEVVGFKLVGQLDAGATGTDLVLKIVKILREENVVGKFVEFFGPGLDALPLADRATIANMAPEYGATCGFFPVDQETLRYLRQTGRSDANVALVEAYARANGLWRGAGYDPVYSSRLELDLSATRTAISGPKRPQDHIPLDQAADAFRDYLQDLRHGPAHRAALEGSDEDLRDGAIVIASITSCTNTSNPHVMVGAGLLARKARERGLRPKPWVKTSLAPGSKVVSAYLENSGLQEDLDALGFNLVGYGCTTCIGNSGPLPEAVSRAISEGGLVAASMLSGNRNFEGRISPDVRVNYLASPPLVVAFAIAGNLDVNLTTEPLGRDENGAEVYLSEIWPSREEIEAVIDISVTRDAHIARYSDVFDGDERWRKVKAPAGQVYDWPPTSTYVQKPPYFDDMPAEPPGLSDILGARVIAVLGDMVTTDHISPAGSFAADSPAGHYLADRQVPPREFNSFGSRRGNHEVMMRGTFGNIRIRNEMLKDIEGGHTLGPDGTMMSIFDAAMAYRKRRIPLVVFGGRQYGMGSSRDWAAKGTCLLGIEAVIAESFERIHRSNLIGMGVVPFEFTGGATRRSLGICGQETVTIRGLSNGLVPGANLACEISMADGEMQTVELLCRVDTETEIEYLRHGGVLHFVLRQLASSDQDLDMK